MTIDLVIPVIRQLLHIIGGYLIAQGYLDDGTLEAFIGLGVNAATLIWWAVDRYRINKANAELARVAADKTDTAGV